MNFKKIYESIIVKNNLMFKYININYWNFK